jgi:hypothetical protein
VKTRYRTHHRDTEAQSFLIQPGDTEFTEFFIPLSSFLFLFSSYPIPVGEADEKEAEEQEGDVGVEIVDPPPVCRPLRQHEKDGE